MINKLNLLSVWSVRETSVRLSRPAFAQGFNDIFNTMLSFGGWVAGRLAWPPTPAANASPRLKRSFRSSRSSRSSCSLGTVLLTGMLGFALLLVGCGGGGDGGGNGGDDGDGITPPTIPNPPAVTDIQTIVGEDYILVGWTNPDQENIIGFNINLINTVDASGGRFAEFNSTELDVSPGARVIVEILDLARITTYEIRIAVLYENGDFVSASVSGTTGADVGMGTDIDQDGVNNDDDAFPLDACAGTDTDEDGIPDTLVAGCDTDLTRDLDDDGDDVPDATDAFRTDACAGTDTDEDGKPDSVVAGCETGLTADLDDDNNGLIEIHNLDQLALLRDDLNGDGEDDNVFPAITPVGSAGCPDGGCLGYELARSLNFSQEASYEENSDKQSAWTNRAGSGWQPIGSCTASDDCTSYTGMFDGRGYAIADLFISANSTAIGIGLFGALNGTIQSLHLLNANVSGGFSDLGMLVGNGRNGQFTNLAIAGGVIMSMVPFANTVGGLVGRGEDVDIRAVSVSDVIVSGSAIIGGLVGHGIEVDIRAVSISGVTVDVIPLPNAPSSRIGGLAGTGRNVRFRHAYVVGGSVSGADSVGGLVGDSRGDISGDARDNRGQVSYSYVASGPISATFVDAESGGLLGSVADGLTIIASYWDNQTTGQLGDPLVMGKGIDQTTAQLQSPTDFTGIYADWGNFWCDPDSFEIQENRTDPGGSFERLWDLGDADQYPVLNCLPVSVEEQQQRQ